MSDTMTFGKRVLAVTTALATIVWAVGLAAFAVPQTAHAASAGDLIRGTSLSSVYYYGYDGLRYTFPNLKTYNTWYSNFDGVMTLSDSAVADITIGGNVVYRPGSRWVKIQSDPKTYAVSTGGTIHWVETEDVAVDFAGSDWNQNIDDVPDVFFIDYSTGTSLMTADAFDGMMYMDGSDYVLALDGEKRVVSAAGRTANNMTDAMFLDGANIDDSALTSGAEITANVCNVTDAAQTGCVDGVVTGDVTVSLSSSTPASATLPKGANAVEMITVDLKAGSSAAEVDALTFSMTGVGATTNISNAYLYEGSSRLTESRSVNASTREVSFNNLGIDLAANETRSFTVRVEIAGSGTATTGDQLKFALSSASAVSAGGSVGGSFPVSGNAFTLAGALAGTLTITKNGTIVDPVIGADDHTIGKFRVAAATEDASLEELTLKIDNSASHSDFKLWQNGVLISTGVDLGKKLVKFDFSSTPFAITEGSNKIFSVTADIGGENGDDVKVYIDKAVDVVASGGNYGFGMAATINTVTTGYDGTTTACTTSAGTCSFSDVTGGDVTITFVGPSAGEIPVNSQDVTLFEFNMTAQNEITVKDLDMLVYGEDDGGGNAIGTGADSNANDNDGLINTNGEGNLKDMKIINRDTGAVLMGPMELDCVTTTCGQDANDQTQTIDFTDDFTISAGETLHLALTADIDNDVAIDSGDTAGVEFAAVMDIGSGSGLVLEDSNGTTIASTAIVPSADLNGYNQKALSSTLGIQLASSPVSTTVVEGTAGVDFLGVVFTAGDASDITITNLTFTGYGDDSDGSAMTVGGGSGFEIEDFISSCSLYEGDTLVDGPKSVSTVGAVVFNTMDWVVDSGSSSTLSLKCNLANPSNADSSDFFAFDLGADNRDYADVTAQDEDSNTPTITITAPATTPGVTDDGVNNTNQTDSVMDASVVITIADAGTLAVTAGSSTPSADYVLTGSTGNHVATYTFAASNEAFNVDKLTFSEEQAEADTGTTDSNAYANNVKKVYIDYPKADGTTGTSSLVSMVGNEATFSGLDMYVAAGKTKDVKVYVNATDTARDTGGSATSNEKLLLSFKSDNVDEMNAVGQSSGVTKTGSDETSITSGIATFVVRETKPTVTLSSSSPSGTGKIPQDMEVLRFNVAASSGEDLVLNEFVFKLSTTDNATSDWNHCASTSGYAITTSDFDFYNLSTTGTGTALDAADGEWALLGTTGATCSSAEVHYVALDLTTPQIVPAGQTYTYSLYFDTTGASSVNDDSIQVSIVGDPMTTYIDAGVNVDATGVSSRTATAFTASADASSAIYAGDVICFSGVSNTTCGAGEEVALVTSVSTTTVNIIRGYLGTDAAAITASSDIVRMPSTLFWQDDGTILDTAAPAEEYYGAYLVDSLPITGGALQF